MRSVFLINIIFFLLFNACTKTVPPLSLEGDWIQAGQYIITDQDTVWQRQAVIWNFKADSSGQITQFQLHQNLEAKTQAIHWQIGEGKLQLATAAAKESWAIIKLTKDSLILEAPQDKAMKQKVYWLFRKMELPTKAIASNELKTFLQKHLFQLESSSYKNSTKLEWEAIGHHFIHPNLPQSWYLPLRWGTINYKGVELIALQAILSGQLNQWEFLEVDSFDEHSIHGRYFKDGKVKQLLFNQTEAHPTLDKKQLIGTWQGNQTVEKLQFGEDGQYQLKSDQGDWQGPYYVSQKAPLIFLQNSYQFQYFKVQELNANLFKAESYSPKKKGTAIELVKGANLQ